MTAGFPDATYQWMIPLQASIQALFNGAGSPPPTFGVNAVGGDTTTDMLSRVATTTALNPDHCIILCGLNDHDNHSGTPIPPATSAANYVAYFAAVKAARPNCKFHVISNMWYQSELWPDGSGAHDVDTQNTNAAIKAVVAAEPNAEWINIRDQIFTFDEPIQNPTDLSSGILTQAPGTHPTKTAGQNVLSNRVYQRLQFGT